MEQQLKKLCLLGLLLSTPILSNGQGFFKKPLGTTGKKVTKALEKAGRDTGKTLEKAGRDTGKTLEKAGQDTGKTLEKAGQDVGKAAEKGLTDLTAETLRAGDHSVDVVKAVGRYLESQITGASETLSSTERRLREGKIMDALFHLTTEQLSNQEKGLFEATQQSGWINTIGATAASAYGGPGGSAAYAAWQTYRISNGNAEFALRAGIIAGLTHEAMGGINKLNGVEVPTMAQKAILAGAVGGLAVAASGGDADDIRDGLILGGGMIIVQDGYRSLTGKNLNGKSAIGDPYCMTPIDPTCAEQKKAYTYTTNEKGEITKMRYDPSNLDERRPHVGIGVDPKNQSTYFTVIDEGTFKLPTGNDKMPLMTGLAKVPGMNAMALFHDTWVVSWDMNPLATKTTIIPAIVLTYMGTGASLYSSIAENNNKLATNHSKNDRQESSSSSEKFSPENEVKQNPVIVTLADLSNVAANNALSESNKSASLVITPDENGNNDTFAFKEANERYWEVAIYNRWGRLIYKTAAYQNDWGKEAESGKYYYIVKQSSLNQTYKGWIEVVR